MKESGSVTLFSYAIRVFADNELKCSKCYDRKAKIAFRTSKSEGKSKCYCRLGKTAWTKDQEATKDHF